jgi:glucokinase
MNDCVVGIDLGGTKIMGAVVDSQGRIRHRVFKLTPVQEGPKAVLDRMVEVVREAVAGAGLTLKDVLAVGIGSPGPLDPDAGVVVSSANLPGWDHVRMKDHVRDATGRPVFMDNDCNVAMLAEHALGVGRGVADLIGLFLGTGIGGGVIIANRLHRGFSKQGGELGHVVVDVNGPKCGCGQRGCIEALASRQVICRQIVEAVRQGRKSVITETDPKAMRTSLLAQALAQKDGLVREVMTKAMEYLGVAVASIAHVVSPEMVILGGGIMEALTDEMLGVVEDSAKKRALPLVMDRVKFVRAQLGEDAGVLGAAVLARQSLACSVSP